MFHVSGQKQGTVFCFLSFTRHRIITRTDQQFFLQDAGFDAITLVINIEDLWKNKKFV